MFAPIGSGRPAGHRLREIRKGRNVRFPYASANRGAARQGPLPIALDGMDRPTRPLLQLRLAAARYSFRESLFALPTVLVAVGVALAEATAYLDRALDDDGPVGWGRADERNGATWLLSTVAGATITTAGVVLLPETASFSNGQQSVLAPRDAFVHP